jgi:hypothetical protein
MSHEDREGLGLNVAEAEVWWENVPKTIYDGRCVRGDSGPAFARQPFLFHKSGTRRVPDLWLFEFFKIVC